VIGIIAVLIGILLPTLSKARKSAKTTVCLSNLRQMGNAWVMYLTDSRGHLPHSVWHQAAPPGRTPAWRDEFIWKGFWAGILGEYRVSSSALLCPEAAIPADGAVSPIQGAGSAFTAWTGKFQNSGNSPVGIMLSNGNADKVNMTNDATKKGYRIGSYGMNQNLCYSYGPDKTIDTADDGKRPADPGTSNTGSSAAWFGGNINQVKPTTEVPVFLDAVWIEFQGMPNGSVGNQPSAPPNLGGGSAPANGDYHWRILIARHGRGINMCYADGHAAWVQLEDTYQQKWTPYWRKYSLNNLPRS